MVSVLGALLLGMVCVAGLSIVVNTFRFGISPMPTSAAVQAEVLSLVPPSTAGRVLELGAGWGTLAFALADRFPHLTIEAWEGSPVPFFCCWLRQRLRPRQNLTLRHGDFASASLSGASGVVTYLWTGGMQQLGPRFERELPPGAWIISHTFAWRGRSPEAERRAPDLYRTRVMRYRR